MKRLIRFLLLTITMLSVVCFGACAKDTEKSTVIKVNEVTHSIFYAPFYVAIEGGFFEDEGLTIELTNGGGSDASMTALLSNSCDVALLGPETGIYTLVGDAKDKPVIFAQLTKRDGSFLLARNPMPNFKWSDLENSEIIAGRRGGSPAMSLEYALNKNGLTNGNNVTLNFDVQFNLTTAAFLGGTGDYVTAFEPIASEYQREGKAYIVASVGLESGEAPFTCFMAKGNYIKNNKQTTEKFVKALYKAFDYIYSEKIEEVAKKILPQFPSTSLQSVVDSLNSYIKIDAWQKDMIMTAEAFNRLQDIMENAGELSTRVNFSDLVDNSIAQTQYDLLYKG